ncbi:MAG TPA: alpha/beta hydrolase [Streptosporangiaceae bacterium]|nr:alpha/beta hydrolase [Streptosporangiaceae bacterium]
MAEFADVSGVRLAYDVGGAGEPPIIFVHGWSCDRSYLAPQVAHFARRHTVLATDLPGHGGSDQPDPGNGRYDVDVLAGDVLAVAAAAGLDRPVLVGHSLGALIGLSCAARPGVLSALVMVDPAPITNERVKAYFRDSAAAVRADTDRSWRTEFAQGFFLPTDTVRRDEIIAAFSAGPPGIAAAVLQAMGEFDGAGALSRATAPVLSIGSAHPPNSSADLRRACARITIGQTVGSGHFNQLEVPAQVNAMIEKFLAINGLSGSG